jgi:hypothetical protein
MHIPLQVIYYYYNILIESKMVRYCGLLELDNQVKPDFNIFNALSDTYYIIEH